MQVDLARLAKQQGVDLGSLVDSNPTPNAALAYLRGANGKVEKVGEEKVRRREHDALPRPRSTSSMPRAGRRAPARRSIRRVIDVGGVTTLPVDVWVGDDGFVRKVGLHGQQSSKSQSAKITMELYDFGSPVTIAPPPETRGDRLRAVAGTAGG